jgi:hypothetical protein
MTLALIAPVAEAAVFTAGCALIHALRHQAPRVTCALLVVLCIVALGVLATALADLGPDDPQQATASLPFENHAAGAIRY